MKASDIKPRCSSLGYLMTEPRGRSEILSETCITHLIDIYVSALYNRREEHTGKMLDKGNLREEDSITLLTRVTKKFYRKNEQRLTNDFISGVPDLLSGDPCEETLDTKTSWSAHTYFRAINKKLNPMYYWQGQGYMMLTGAKRHTVAYCLVNGLDTAILDEKRKLQWKMGIIDPSEQKPDSEFIRQCKQIEVNHIFDLKSFLNEYPYFELDNDPNEWKWDIPMEKRLSQFTFERNDQDLIRLQNRIVESWKYMDKYLFKNVA